MSFRAKARQRRSRGIAGVLVESFLLGTRRSFICPPAVGSRLRMTTPSTGMMAIPRLSARFAGAPLGMTECD